MWANKGRDVLLAFNKDLGPALGKACELDSDSVAVHITYAVQFVYRHMFVEAKPFFG